MTSSRTRARTAPDPAPRLRAFLSCLALAALGASACGGPGALPPPRPLVVSSGARLTADPERLQQIHDWVVPQDENIEEDPTFLIVSIASEQDTYPWETLVIQGDTARFQHTRANPDIQTSYQIYAHFHLMKQMGRLAPWLPEAASAEGYELERAIVARTADSWLLGRAIFDAQPHALMDELVYAKEAGHLDAFLLTLRGEEFAAARDTWVAQNPDGLESYRDWFRSTFNGEPPGIRASRGGR